MIRTISDQILSLLERKPYMGYFGAVVPTSAGLWTLVQKLTAIGALVSIVVGIAVGIITFVVQRETLRKLRSEDSK